MYTALHANSQWRQISARKHAQESERPLPNQSMRLFGKDTGFPERESNR